VSKTVNINYHRYAPVKKVLTARYKIKYAKAYRELLELKTLLEAEEALTIISKV